MKTNDGERLVRKPEKHIRHLVLNARDLPRHLEFDLALETGSNVGNATSLALLRHCLAFTSIRGAGQRTSGLLLSSTFADVYVTERQTTQKRQKGTVQNANRFTFVLLLLLSFFLITCLIY